MNKLKEANEWEERAVYELGDCFMATPTSGSGQIELRLLRAKMEDLVAEDFECLIELVTLMKDNWQRRKKAAPLPAPVRDEKENYHAE